MSECNEVVPILFTKIFVNGGEHATLLARKTITLIQHNTFVTAAF